MLRYKSTIFTIISLLLLQRVAVAQTVGTQSVSGTITSLSVSADHANVKSLLLAVFKQVGMQYVPDDTVKGEITFNLSNANLNTVLKEICSQDALKFTVDNRGVYRFTQNTQALQAQLFAHQTNGVLLAQKLRQFGYSVSAPIIVVPGTANNPAVTGQALTPWDAMMRRNGTVGVDIPAGKPIPVYRVLQEFSLQSNVRIAIDPAIAKNPSFRIDGHIVRPLPQALQLLGQVGHLTIVRTATGYFVTPAPDFRIFYGSSTAPRTAFP